MANYSKRDAQKAWVLDMATSRKPPPDKRLRCHCGELAVIAFTSEKGESQFFCEAHQAEADALANRRK
jgi:hypothetical protein